MEKSEKNLSKNYGGTKTSWLFGYIILTFKEEIRLLPVVVRIRIDSSWPTPPIHLVKSFLHWVGRPRGCIVLEKVDPGAHTASEPVRLCRCRSAPEPLYLSVCFSMVIWRKSVVVWCGLCGIRSVSSAFKKFEASWPIDLPFPQNNTIPTFPDTAKGHLLRSLWQELTLIRSLFVGMWFFGSLERFGWPPIHDRNADQLSV